MSIRDILHGVRRSRHLALAAAVVLSAGCAPRQARVESEPNPGAPGGAPTSSESVGDQALTADLQRLALAQEEYQADTGYYATRLGDLEFAASSGVRVSIIQGDRRGWSAVASSGDDECGMYHGDVRSPRGYLTAPDRVACR